jgi:hypothetical protein
MWSEPENRPPKRYLLLDDDVPRHPVPLAAVYLLGPRAPSLRRPSVTALSAAEALSALMEHRYVPYILDAAGQARDFLALGRLVRHVPVRRLERPDDLGRLDDVCDLVLDDVAAIGPA